MMAALIQFLLADETIKSLVADRIRPLRSDDGDTRPRIIVQKVSGPRIAGLGGPTGLSQPRYQISCWASTYADASAISEAVRLSGLDGFRGDMNGVDVQSAMLIDEREFDEPSPGNDAQAAIEIQQDYEIMHRESFNTPAFIASAE